MTAPGFVYLVGAGPWDPGLLTLRGRDLLNRADAVLYDYLVNPELLDHLPPEAERIPVGAPPQRMTQAEINTALVDRARRGQVVVRLKGGDPFVFGRGGEEAEALVHAGRALRSRARRHRRHRRRRVRRHPRHPPRLWIDARLCHRPPRRPTPRPKPPKTTSTTPPSRA
jgi:hypothetical protein